MASPPKLPPELILLIVEALIPSNPPVAFPPSHPVTRTLLNLTLTSTLTSQLARKLLFTYCMYLNTDKKIINAIQWLKPDESRTRPNLFHGQETSLFLGSVPTNEMDVITIGDVISDLAKVLNNRVRRLVVDIPTGQALDQHSDEPAVMQEELNYSFTLFKALEEFCWLQEAVGHHFSPWHLWEKLRCLALYKPKIGVNFIADLGAYPELSHIVLTRPTVLREAVAELSDSEDEYFSFVDKLKRVTIVDCSPGNWWPQRYDERYDMEDWDLTFAGLLLTSFSRYTSRGPGMLELVYVQLPSEMFHDDSKEARKWIESHALDGTLWDIPGEVYEPGEVSE